MARDLRRGYVRVLDDGPGLSSEAVDKVFERYESASPQPGLTEPLGIGLGVCRDLARLMGGDITFVRNGRFSVFELSLPVPG